MESNSIFDGTFSALEKVLDLRSIKHNLIVSNIANVDTPHYKAFDLIVEEELGKALNDKNSTDIERTQERHLPFRKTNAGNVRPKVVAEPQLSLRGDGNSVEIDAMMAKLAENNLMYNALAQILSKKFNGLKYAIQEGRR
jgi:flagellar basal-body rod protein FlgB